LLWVWDFGTGVGGASYVEVEHVMQIVSGYSH